MAIMTKLFAPAIDIRELPPVEIRMIVATRSWVIARKLGKDSYQYLESKLREPGLAERFALLLEAIGSVWPEPFLVKPPCCRGVSYDEMLVLKLIRAAAMADRPAFDLNIKDMLAEDARALLYCRASGLFAA